MEYIVVSGSCQDLFEEQVNELLAGGWKLSGGLIVIRGEYENVRKGYMETYPEFFQAMIRDGGSGAQPKQLNQPFSTKEVE